LAASVIYTLSLHDALPIFDLADRSSIVARHLVRAGEMGDEVARVGHAGGLRAQRERAVRIGGWAAVAARADGHQEQCGGGNDDGDRKSTRLNSSHVASSYA